MGASAANADFSEFIEKLLTSDKLNILVDRVAEKTLEKLKNQQRYDKYKAGQLGQGRNAENHNILRNDDPINDLLTTMKGAKPNGHRGEPGKIDLQAVKQKYASFPFEQLSLKYKHFTNSDGRENAKLTSERTVPKNYESKGNHEEMSLRLEKREQKDADVNRYKEEMNPSDFDLSAEHVKQKKGSIEQSNRETEMLPTDEKSDFVVSHFEDHKFKSRSDPKSKPYYPFKHILPESLSSVNKQFRTNEQKQSDQENEVTNESQDAETEEKPAMEEDRAVAVEALAQAENPAQVDNPAQADNPAQVDNPAQADNPAQPVLVTNNNLILRREGDQILAFEQSPDYAEYHEKYEKAKKKKQKSQNIA